MKNSDLFSTLAEERIKGQAPLAAQCRPRSLDDFVGQSKLLASGSPLQTWINRSQIPSLIIWGPPGSGKTSFARLLGEMPSYEFIELGASEAGVADFKKIFADVKSKYGSQEKRTLLFVDEIHRLSKLQQDALLKGVEEGLITLVGVTTENPQYSINRALLSRAQVLKFEALSVENLIEILKRGIARAPKVNVSESAELNKSLGHLITSSNGDARRALNFLEMILLTDAKILENSEYTESFLKELGAERALLALDDEVHYRLISDYIKGMRASNEEVAMDRLVRLLSHGEDPVFIARRLLIFSAEDVGLASPHFLTYALAVFEAVTKVGMPEARIHLSVGTLAACRAKKSREAYEKLADVEEQVARGGALPV